MTEKEREKEQQGAWSEKIVKKIPFLIGGKSIFTEKDERYKELRETYRQTENMLYH